MSVPEKSSASSSSSALTSPSSSSVRDIDPLLKDLNEKKQSFRKNVVSLAAELKEVRGRLASKEQSFAKETLNRKARDFVIRCFLFCFECLCSVESWNHSLFFLALLYNRILLYVGPSQVLGS